MKTGQPLMAANSVSGRMNMPIADRNRPNWRHPGDVFIGSILARSRPGPAATTQLDRLVQTTLKSQNTRACRSEFSREKGIQDLLISGR
jgi:hypothetical protein